MDVIATPSQEIRRPRPVRIADFRPGVLHNTTVKARLTQDDGCAKSEKHLLAVVQLQSDVSSTVAGDGELAVGVRQLRL